MIPACWARPGLQVGLGTFARPATARPGNVSAPYWCGVRLQADQTAYFGHDQPRPGHVNIWVRSGVNDVTGCRSDEASARIPGWTHVNSPRSKAYSQERFGGMQL